MKVALLTTANSHRAGGLYYSVPNLAHGIHSKGIDVSVVSYDDEHSQRDSAVYGDLPHVKYTVSRLPLLRSMGYSGDIHRVLDQVAPDIVHNQGIWMYHSCAALRYRNRHRGAATIIQPRGMLDPWAVRNSAWKKRIAGWLYESKNLKRANCIYALCQSEYESVRKFGLSNPVAVIPNGFNLPVNPVYTRRNSGGRRALLYVGRIHPKKGLREMIEGLAEIKRNAPGFFADWEVRIAGWDQGGHIVELQRLVADGGLAGDVKFLGSVYGTDKERELCAASAFILPSFSEGLPMSVLEAWAYRLPVVMTDFCNLPDGFATGSAHRIAPTASSIAQGLMELYEMNEDELSQMGENGYKLMQSKYTWDSIADKTVELYHWLLGEGDKPEFVHLD